MAEQFYTILTAIGKAKVANSGALGTKVNFVKFKVGDGNGSYYNPTENQTELKNQVWEGNISSIYIDEENSNWIVIEAVIPTLVGGFTIREAGVFDDEGNLIAIGKYPETYKPVSSDGSTKDLLMRMILEVSNAENINLKVDPTIILATKKDIQVLESKFDKKIEEINAHLNDITKKIDNIDLSAEKVKLSGVTGIEATDVKAAIQELFTNASDGQSAVAGEVGIDTKSTWANIKSSILSAKNTIVANLKNKAVNTDNTQSLATLASKIASIPTQAAQTITPGTTNKTITANRFLTGIQTILGDANLIAANIIAGKSIFGVAGSASIESLGGRKYASGTVTSTSGDSPTTVNISGFNFVPSIAIIYSIYNGNVTTLNVLVNGILCVGATSNYKDGWVSGVTVNSIGYGNLSMNVRLSGTSNYNYILIE